MTSIFNSMTILLKTETQKKCYKDDILMTVWQHLVTEKILNTHRTQRERTEQLD